MPPFLLISLNAISTPSEAGRSKLACGPVRLLTMPILTVSAEAALVARPAATKAAARRPLFNPEAITANPPLLRPELFPEFAPEHLAHTVAGQGFQHDHGFRMFEFRKLADAEAEHFVVGNLFAFAQHQAGPRRLAPFLVLHADHGPFQHLWMLAQHALDLGRIDVFPAADDGVALAVEDVQEAVLVHHA